MIQQNNNIALSFIRSHTHQRFYCSFQSLGIPTYLEISVCSEFDEASYALAAFMCESRIWQHIPFAKECKTLNGDGKKGFDPEVLDICTNHRDNGVPWLECDLYKVNIVIVGRLVRSPGCLNVVYLHVWCAHQILRFCGLTSQSGLSRWA